MDFSDAACMANAPNLILTSPAFYRVPSWWTSALIAVVPHSLDDMDFIPHRFFAPLNSGPIPLYLSPPFILFPFPVFLCFKPTYQKTMAPFFSYVLFDPADNSGMLFPKLLP